MPRHGRTHGTRSCYAGGCRLPECVEAARTYWRQYNKLARKYAGSDQLVDASRTIKHIRRLRELGVGRDVIARAAGMRKSQIFQIDHEQHKQVRQSTERKILAVRPDDSFMVPATGTSRRLQALAAIGHTLDSLATEVGSNPVYLSLVTRGKNRYVYRSTADKVAEVFDRMSMTPGSSVHSKARALAKGWAPPMAWDEDSMDDPAARPVGARRQETKPPRLDLDEWEALVKSGEDIVRATRRCGSTLAAVERAAWRAGRNDLAAMVSHEMRRYAA